jgi:LysR family transcriptional activator of nhaA
MKINSEDQSIWLNYNHLYYFMVVAREGSIARASQKLSLGQSALSIQLKQLESALGVELFSRSHKKMALTENGKVAFDYAKDIFKLGAEMVESLLDRPTDERIHIHIGLLDTIPKHLSLQLAMELKTMRGNTASFLEGKSDELFRELVNHRIDLMVTNRVPMVTTEKVYSRKIARLPLFVVGARKFIGLRKDFPKSLNHQPFIAPTNDNQTRHDFAHYCELLKIIPDITMESQDIMVQKLLAINGMGLIVVPEFSVKEYLKNKTLFTIGKVDEVYEELFMIAASRKINNPLAEELMKRFKIKL